jgi:site-specific DNA-methyltransferase (adenine-specific)
MELPINQIICGDCLEVMKTFPDKSVDLVLTDPPYGINYQSNRRVVSKKFDKLENDDNNSRFEAYKEYYRILKDNCVAIVFCSFKNYADDFNELKKYFDIKNCIVWDKGGGGIGDLVHSLSTDYELAIVAHKGMCPIRGKRYGSVWQSGKVNLNTMFHPTEKPVDLVKRLMQSFSDDNNIILDSYLGGGTTAVAAKQLHRRYIGIEISQKYCDIAKQRLKQEVLI